MAISVKIKNGRTIAATRRKKGTRKVATKTSRKNVRPLKKQFSHTSSRSSPPSSPESSFRSAGGTSTTSTMSQTFSLNSSSNGSISNGTNSANTSSKRNTIPDPLGFRVGVGAEHEHYFATPSEIELRQIWATFTAKERSIIQKLDSPMKIQTFLDEQIKYDPVGGTKSIRAVLQTKSTHCMGGSVFANYCLTRLGYETSLIGFNGANNDGHAICIWREKTKQPYASYDSSSCNNTTNPLNNDTYLYGAISKSNYSGLRSRDCVYASVRELVMSYFNFYFNISFGEKSIIEWNIYNPWNHRSKCVRKYENKLARRNRNAFFIERARDRIKNDKVSFSDFPVAKVPVCEKYYWLFLERGTFADALEKEFDDAKWYPILRKRDEIRVDGVRQDTESQSGKRFFLASKTLKKAAGLDADPSHFSKG